ncbi:MAG: DUF4249 domain-containing protein [Brumimicrobium sp.]|nr:DUF4249 domain-containing protein [Brumimicrobium sp.]
MKRVFILWVVIALAFVSCEKVIDLKVNDIEEKVVIDANYDAVNQRVEVKLTTTKDVFSGSEFPAVEGALIEIIDPSGNITTVPGIGGGNYLLTGYAPEYNSNYTLRVNYNNTLYEATTILPSVVALDSLTQEFQEASIFGEAGYVVFMNFTDPLGANYYRAIRKVNGEYLTELSQQFIFDDTFSEGNNQKVPFFNSRYEIGDSVIVEFRSYSEESYDYYTQLFDLAGDSGNNAAPANPETNWSNGALGHFSAYGFDSKLIVIQE